MMATMKYTMIAQTAPTRLCRKTVWAWATTIHVARLSPLHALQIQHYWLTAATTALTAILVNGMRYYDDFYKDFEDKLPKDEKIDRPGNAFLLNVFYMETVGNELLDRYEKRDSKIQEWIARDRAKDEQISSARLAEEPSCHHCGKQGLRIIDKSLMHRGETYEIDDSEEVLFMLRCPHCDKNSAFWEDCTVWKVKPTVCPKCQSEVTHKTTKTNKAITHIYMRIM